MTVRPAKTQISLGIRPVWSVFALRMKKALVLSYPWSAQQRLIRLAGCPGWSESLLGAQSVCWFVMRRLIFSENQGNIDTKLCCSRKLTIMKNEPAHEIMALFDLRKLIFQTRMRSHPVGLDAWCLVGPFVYFHTSCVRPGAVARSEASSLGMQAAPSSIPTSGTFFRGDLVMKTFLRPFSLSHWSKKSSCQLLAKECALSTGKLPRRLAQEQCG